MDALLTHDFSFPCFGITFIYWIPLGIIPTNGFVKEGIKDLLEGAKGVVLFLSGIKDKHLVTDFYSLAL